MDLYYICNNKKNLIMFFPILVPSTLKSSSNQEKQIASLETLDKYTSTSKEVFEKKFYNQFAIKKLSLLESIQLAKDFYSFDNLKEKEKKNLVAFVEDPTYGTIKFYLKQIFRK